jgi:succinate dehydrogenase / fumarate reductase flavoprotein subunit
MGGIRVDADSQMSSVAGLFAAGECAAGLHGANRLGGNSLSDLLVFGRRAGQYAAAFAQEHPAVAVEQADVATAATQALAPFERAGEGESPFQVQHALQDMMQDKVGIVRREEEMRQALEAIAALRERAAVVTVPGNREYNPGWHTAIDLANLLDISEAITRAALDRRESRGGHFREDFPDKDAEAAKYNTVIQRGADGTMVLRREPVTALSAEQAQIIEEQKT